eukprot:6455502-Prymnesium_polylepis.1
MDLHRAGRQELGVADEDADAHREALRRLLERWCVLRPELGYIQGLNCIGAALLVLCDHAEEEAIALLVMLIERLPADWSANPARRCPRAHARPPRMATRGRHARMWARLRFKCVRGQLRARACLRYLDSLKGGRVEVDALLW